MSFALLLSTGCSPEMLALVVGDTHYFEYSATDPAQGQPSAEDPTTGGIAFTEADASFEMCGTTPEGQVYTTWGTWELDEDELSITFWGWHYAGEDKVEQEGSTMVGPVLLPEPTTLSDSSFELTFSDSGTLAPCEEI